MDTAFGTEVRSRPCLVVRMRMMRHKETGETFFKWSYSSSLSIPGTSPINRPIDKLDRSNNFNILSTLPVSRIDTALPCHQIDNYGSP